MTWSHGNSVLNGRPLPQKRHVSAAKGTGPSFMTDDQMARFLADLRSQPRPTHKTREYGFRPAASETSLPPKRPLPVLRSIRGAHMEAEIPDQIQGQPELDNPQQQEQPERYTIPYYERGQRWMERQENHSLRAALGDMDEADRRVHEAAQDEANRLVHEHQHPGAPYAYPKSGNLGHTRTRDYKPHLRKDSHALSQGVGPFESLHVQLAGAEWDSMRSSTATSRRTASSESKSSSGSSISDRMGRLAQSLSSRRRRISASLSSRHHRDLPDIHSDATHSPRPEMEHWLPGGQKKAWAIPNPPRNGRRLPPSPPDSGHSTDADAARASMQNNNPHQAGMLGEREIRSPELRAATSRPFGNPDANLPTPSFVSQRPDRPIVSFDRAWTPPSPDKGTYPGLSTSLSTGNQNSSDRAHNATIPSITIGPEIPSISVESEQPRRKSEIPTIQLEPDLPAFKKASDIPVINIESDLPTFNITVDAPSNKPTENMSTRPLPRAAAHGPKAASSRMARDTSDGPINGRAANRWTPASHASRQQAQCAACALPISGRIVTAASQRFHPACFTCYQCGELLECVAFYLEPEQARERRLARIAARLAGHELVGDDADISAEADGDDSVRFYCHLDFHETFSPRCRSCKTPIEGEVIVACGGEWHAGHFFCAECGDPFEATTPYVERDGFAWCTGCHCKRFSGKCAGCRRPITDLVLNALDREWHEACFRCSECGSGFDDGNFFTRNGGMDPVCVACEERRLKA